MFKLVILIEEMEDSQTFDDAWPKFLHLAESMPGLQRETFSRVEVVLFGSNRPGLVHELYFDSLEAARTAMASPSGKEAGRLLQQITGGRMTLFLADHKENSLENTRKHAAEKS
ncbi:MAG: EthD family reductase [Anaerolineales bacterium]|nr:EthD family reductase [Anaerolineales bacterium]